MRIMIADTKYPNEPPVPSAFINSACVYNIVYIKTMLRETGIVEVFALLLTNDDMAAMARRISRELDTVKIAHEYYLTPDKQAVFRRV